MAVRTVRHTHNDSPGKPHRLQLHFLVRLSSWPGTIFARTAFSHLTACPSSYRCTRIAVAVCLPLDIIPQHTDREHSSLFTQVPRRWPNPNAARWSLFGSKTANSMLLYQPSDGSRSRELSHLIPLAILATRLHHSRLHFGPPIWILLHNVDTSIESVLLVAALIELTPSRPPCDDI